MVTDITGLRRAEEGLKESEEKYRMVVELSDDGIAWTQGDHHIFANRKMAEIFGYDRPEELVGQSVAEVTHPEDRDRVMRIHSSRLRGEIAPSRYEFKGIKKNGEEVDIEVSAIRTFYQGEWGSLAFLRDITDRKKAEKELEEGRELYQTLVEMSSDAIIMMKGGIHYYVNPRMIEIFGYSHPNEIIGHSMIKMIHPDDRERVQEINRKRQEGKPVPAKYVFKGIRRDGQIIFLETSARRLQYRGENVSLVFLRDITDRVQAEEELKASEEKYRLVVEHANEAIFIAQDGFPEAGQSQGGRDYRLRSGNPPDQAVSRVDSPRRSGDGRGPAHPPGPGRRPAPRRIPSASSTGRGRSNGWRSTPCVSTGKGARPPLIF